MVYVNEQPTHNRVCVQRTLTTASTGCMLLASDWLPDSSTLRSALSSSSQRSRVRSTGSEADAKGGLGGPTSTVGRSLAKICVSAAH